MMDGGRKTLILLTLCALVGANEVQQLVTNLDILISVPSMNIGDTEIVSTVLTVSASHSFRYTVIAQKNQTKCINSTNSLCPSLIRPPALDVLVSARTSDGKTVTYSASINESLELAVYIGPAVSVTPQVVNDGSDAITVLLDLIYEHNTIRRLSTSRRWPVFNYQPRPPVFNSRPQPPVPAPKPRPPVPAPKPRPPVPPKKPRPQESESSAEFSFSVEFTTTITEEEGQGDGVPALHSAPLCAFLLLALLPVLLLK